jgi:uncharacterized protein involved in outer membrane biogenesis
MLKKILIGVVVLALALTAGVYFWARAVLGGDAVRSALAAQLSSALGQQVTIGGVGATIYPRVTVKLSDVSIGQPARIVVRTLDVGTDFRALLSRRIEHATLNLAGARIELPLPDLAIGASPAGGEPTGASPLEIVSIDEIVLSEVDIVSSGRTLRGSVELVPEGTGLTIRKIALQAEGTTIDITGRVDDLARPAGQLTVRAGVLDVDQLLAFASDFAGGAGIASASATGGAEPVAPAAATPRATASAFDFDLTLEADRATMGGLTIERLSGRARVTPTAMTLEPIAFGVFGGRYEGALVLSLDAVPDFRVQARLSDVDMTAATAFAGSPDQISGRLSGDLTLSGSGMDAPTVMKTARGTIRMNVADGSVKNLGLVRTVVIATGGGGLGAQGGSNDEPFSRLGGTLSIGEGTATTDDLTFESRDLLLAASGAIRLDGSAIDLKGQLQLSEELTKQAGSDLVRYTQKQGKVTFPATITGSADKPTVRLDIGQMARRALTNRAQEEAQKALKGRLGGFLGR